MRLVLADHVHGALVDDDLVLLDVKADAYFCLPAGEQSLALTGRLLEARPDSLAQSLCEAGLAREADLAMAADQTAPMRPARTARTLIEAEPELGRLAWRGRHLAALARAARAARRAERHGFADRLRPRAGAPPALSPTLLADLAVYRRLLPWLPIDGACLFRSQMLRAYLRALGHEATWTFGVRTWPFRAHCWLQVEDVALDDEAERLAAFHPILAV